jgi:hypothetical protein
MVVVVKEAALGTSQVAGGGVEDGILFSEARGPVAVARDGVGEVPLAVLWRLEDGAREGGGGSGRGRPSGGGRLSVWISKAAAAAAVRCPGKAGVSRDIPRVGRGTSFLGEDGGRGRMEVKCGLGCGWVVLGSVEFLAWKPVDPHS